MLNHHAHFDLERHWNRRKSKLKRKVREGYNLKFRIWKLPMDGRIMRRSGPLQKCSKVFRWKSFHTNIIVLSNLLNWFRWANFNKTITSNTASAGLLSNGLQEWPCLWLKFVWHRSIFDRMIRGGSLQRLSTRIILSRMIFSSHTTDWKRLVSNENVLHKLLKFDFPLNVSSRSLWSY